MNFYIKSIMPVIVSLLLLTFLVSGCNDDIQELGIGPVKKVELTPNIDNALVEKGRGIFENKCVACHKLDDKLVGPPLHGVTKKRKPEWIMNMILNPEQMTKENLEAKKLFGQYLTQMTFQNVTEQDARAILEYLRSVDSK
ncbi:MAG: cytochrome c [Ignavibacteria bacterium]|nr:cytochrome c [Ignavibacteria bacterium]